MKCFNRLTVLLAGVLAASPALAQTTTTQPAEEVRPSPAPTVADWSTTVDRFTTALVNGDRAAARASTSSEGLSIVRAGSTEQIDLATVVGRSAGGALLASHVYVFPPIALAADLAADFKTSPVIDEKIKAMMVPGDDEAMTRANATAIQWLTQALGATKDAPVAVAIVLPPTAAGSQKTPLPLLVLLRGAVAADNSVNIVRIVYGTPLQIVE